MSFFTLSETQFHWKCIDTHLLNLMSAFGRVQSSRKQQRMSAKRVLCYLGTVKVYFYIVPILWFAHIFLVQIKLVQEYPS